MSRKKIAPDAAAAHVAQIPPRLLKKLDAEPTLAERWTWTAEAVTTDKGELVTFTVTDDVITLVACSCLLAPKCLHVAAVIAVLEPAEPAAAPAAARDEAPVAIAALDEPAAAAARHAFRVASEVLAGGAESAGAFVQAELLRAIHACRTEGLHRLGAALTRVLRSVRDLRADHPEFALGALVADLREALFVAHELAAGGGGTALVGTARRDYEMIGNLRLHGVATEAIVARTGYAGAVTYLIDDKGTLYSRADVAPGDAARAAGAYDAPANIGDAVLPHRELCRSGLFVSNATASADGRLGAGSAVRAVRASEPSRWDTGPLAARFAMPLADQLAALAARDGVAAGWDLVFVDGVVLGGSPRGVGLAVDAAALVLATAHDHRALAARDNLAALARAPGLHVRVLGRARLGVPRRLELLAIGPAPGETRFAMPDAWHGRANVDYDRITLPALAEAPAAALDAPPRHDDLLEALRRRIERIVQGGAGTLPVHAIGELEREANALAERAMIGGASVLRDLAALAHDASRGATGARKELDRPTFARAWLRAALYEDAARRRLSIAIW